jgi:peptidoglycan/LPS O-acetylase OafA/YrhL
MTPRRYRSLDAWRGAACLLVILYHATLFWSAQYVPSSSSFLDRGATVIIRGMRYGNVGVAIFFVISGYCIAAACESVRSGRHTVPRYFIRRFRRIYPPLWAVIALSVGFFLAVDVLIWPRLLSTDPWMQPRPWWYSGWQWVGNLTLTSVTLRTWNLNADGFFFDGQWIAFAAGVAVYWALAGQRSSRHARGLALLVILAALSIGVQVAYLPVALAFAMLLILLARFDETLANARWIRPLNVCGEMCYSLYLVHQLIARAVAAASWDLGLRSAIGTVLVVVPVSVALSLIAGRGCYLLVQRRFMNTRPVALGQSSAASTPDRLSRLSMS